VNIKKDIRAYLKHAESVILPQGEIFQPVLPESYDGKLHIGVDLGTAYLVLVVLNDKMEPVIGEYRFAQVVRDGLVVDYIGAVDLIRDMKRNIEANLGTILTHAATGYPPGVPEAEVRAGANVVEAADMVCTGLIAEPCAANELLNIKDGAILDVGGGTTGLAVIKNGEVIYSADEATGGTHFSLVIAGAMDISFEEAEEMKKKPEEQSRLFPLVRPVMEKVASIAAKHLDGYPVEKLILVGGSSAFPGMAKVVEDYIGIPTHVPPQPMLITPIGIAMHDA
jgi:ethanolamine utilization protein EutJ